jgi:hypothetical protein
MVVGLFFMIRMFVIMRPMISGMFMAVIILLPFVGVRMTVFMTVFMGMCVLVFMAVLFVTMIVFVFMSVGMFMFVLMLMFVIAFHNYHLLLSGY